MSKYIIVTGGLGYIGSHTIVELINNNYIPIVWDNMCNSNINMMKKIKEITGKTIIFDSIDISKEYVFTIAEKYKYYNIVGILHFAALKSVSESCLYPLLYYKNNLNGLINVLEIMVRYDINNLIFSSSATVYSTENILPFDEKQEVGSNLTCPYGKTKYFGEEILKDFHSKYNFMKIISLRYFNPVGAHKSKLIGDNPNNKAENLFPIIKEILEKKREQLLIFGNDYTENSDTSDKTARRDYIHIEDLSLGHLAALKYIDTNSPGLIDFINLGTGKSISVLEIVNGFKEYCNVDIPYSIVERRKGDLASSYANCDKALQILNWKAEKTLKDCIVSYYDFIKL